MQVNLAANKKWFYVLKVFSALGFCFPIWYLYESQFINLSQILIIEAVVFGSQVLFEIPTGAVADLWGYKLSTGLGYLLITFSMIVFLLASSFGGFIIYGLLMGLGEALKSGAEDALEYDTFKSLGEEKDFVKKKSSYSLVFQISLALAFFIGGWIGKWNLEMTIVMTVISQFMATIVVFKLTEPIIFNRHQPSISRYFNQFLEGLKEITKDKLTTNVSLFYILAGAISWPVNVSLATIFLYQLGYKSEQLGLLLAVIRVVNISMIVKLIRNTSHHENRNLIYLFFMTLFIIGYIPAAVVNWWQAILLLILIMISTTSRWIIIGNLAHKQYQSNNRATAFSTNSMLIGLMHTIVMLIAGNIMPKIGGAKMMISLMGLIGVILLLPLWWQSVRLSKDKESYGNKN